jgi:RHS repeat-associated protein
MFTGRELDEETGLYYYRARMYSSKTGRFLQPDPIGYYDSANLYQYCGNNSVNFVDPMGLCEETIDEKVSGFTEKIRDDGYSARYQTSNSSGGYVDRLLSEIGRMAALLQGQYAASMYGQLAGYGPSYGDTQYYKWLLLQYVDATMSGMSTSVQSPSVRIGQRGIHTFIDIGGVSYGYGNRGIRSPDDYGTAKATYQDTDADPIAWLMARVWEEEKI